MSEYREKRVVVEEVPVGRSPVIESQHDTIVHERSGLSGATISAIVIAAIAAAVLITLMIVNGNQQSREDDLTRQRDRAEADARAAQAAKQQPVQQTAPPQSQPSTIVVPVPVPVPSASQPAPSTTEPAVSDTSIEVDITSKLLDDGDLRSHPVDVKVSGGTATLSGNLPNEDLKARTERIAKTIKGVRRVVNDITVIQ
jgi:osmotically-inducible protein OsmY